MTEAEQRKQAAEIAQEIADEVYGTLAWDNSGDVYNYKRDLTADLAICEASTPGPWVVDGNIASQIRQPNGSKRRRITLPPDTDGITDAVFIAEARTGWPIAIKRALAAESERLTLNCRLYEVERERDYLRRINADWKEEVERLRGALRYVGAVANELTEVIEDVR
jgi:hypothetical protein